MARNRVEEMATGSGSHGNTGLLPTVPSGTLGRERSGFTSSRQTGLRPETSYASTTASRVSITPVSLDALESILENYSAGRGIVQSVPLTSTAIAAEGEGWKRGQSPMQARRAAVGGRGQGRSPGGVGTGPSSVHGKPVAGGSRVGVGGAGVPSKGPSLRAMGRASPTTGVLDQSGVDDQAADEQEGVQHAATQAQLPGLPPGSAFSMSNRAATVLMGPESAAHLRRVIPLEQGALENHYVIANPAGETLIDLEEVCDGTMSVDGLPLGRDAVVLLTTAADGVPVPRVVTLDTGPGPNSLRRTGGLGGLWGPRISASGSEMASYRPTASPRASAAGMTVVEGAAAAGPYDGLLTGSGEGPSAVVPPLWSSQGGPAGGLTRASLSGRPLPSPHRSGTVQQSPHNKHGGPVAGTSTALSAEHTTLALPAVPAVGSGSGRRGNISGLMTGSGSAASSSQLPQLPGRPGLLDSLGAGGSGPDAEAPGSQIGGSASRSEPSTPRMWSAASARVASGRQDRYLPAGLVIPGAGASEERAVSPTKARLQGRINALMAQRNAEAAASGGTVLGAPAGGQKVLSTLSGMELVQMALKQVEHGEKTLMDPWGRQMDPAARPGSHGSQAPVDEGDFETEEERDARIEIERRQARLVRALTTLLVTGRERNPAPYMTLSVTDGLSQVPSAATSRVTSRAASVAWSRAASTRMQSARAVVRSRRQSQAPEDDLGHLRRASGGSSIHPIPFGAQAHASTSPRASEPGSPVPTSYQPLPLPPKPERHVRVRLHVDEAHPASPSQRNSHAGDEGGGPGEVDKKQQTGKLSAPHSPGRESLAGGSQLASPHPPQRQGDATGLPMQPAATQQQQAPAELRTHSVVGSEGGRALLPADLATVMRYHGDLLSRGTALTGIGAWEPPDPDVEESLEEAARVAEQGGLDFEELLEFVAHLDSANQEFKLVEAARDRSRRVEAMLASAPGGGGGRGDSPRRIMALSGELPGTGVDMAVMHLLTKRRDGRVSNVAQFITSYATEPAQLSSDTSTQQPPTPPSQPGLSQPQSQPLGVELEALLGSITEALSTDLADMANQATRFDETFRLRTEQYLSALCRLNPVAFEETSAAQAEADYRSSVERAKLRLRQLHGEVEGEMLTSAGKPKNQYDKAVAMLQSNRPYFLPPMFTKEAVQRAPVSPTTGGKLAEAARPTWDVHTSIFRERKKCDARDVVDTEAVLAKQFDLDWSRVVSKMLFMKLVAREDQGVRGKGGRLALEQELAEVRQELLAAFPLIRSAFIYFSISPAADTYVAACEAAAAAAIADGRSPEAAAADIADAAVTATTVILSAGAVRSASPSRRELARSDSSIPPLPPPPPVSESVAAARAAVGTLAAAKPPVPSAGYAFFEMDESHWLAFCSAVGIAGTAPGVRVHELRSLFWTVNREEEKNLTLESVANSDYAYMRFEFMEALVRAAFARYIQGGVVTDCSDATKMLLQHLRRVLPPLAVVDPNVFRRERLYTADMERAIVHNLELLTAAFKLFKARDKAKYMDICHWMSFVESNNLLAPHMGLTVTEARLMFAWSQTVVVDELKLRRRAVSLQLWDFVEAVARVADRISLPVTEEMDKWMLYNLNIGRNTPLPPGHTRVWTYCTALTRGKGPGLPRRASSSNLLAAATRPLAVKFRAFMDYLAGHMADHWGGSNSHETAQNMLRTASMLSGGVELA